MEACWLLNVRQKLQQRLGLWGEREVQLLVVDTSPRVSQGVGVGAYGRFVAKSRLN